MCPHISLQLLKEGDCKMGTLDSPYQRADLGDNPAQSYTAILGAPYLPWYNLTVSGSLSCKWSNKSHLDTMYLNYNTLHYKALIQWQYVSCSVPFVIVHSEGKKYIGFAAFHDMQVGIEIHCSGMWLELWSVVYRNATKLSSGNLWKFGVKSTSNLSLIIDMSLYVLCLTRFLFDSLSWNSGRNLWGQGCGPLRCQFSVVNHPIWAKA